MRWWRPRLPYRAAPLRSAPRRPQPLWPASCRRPLISGAGQHGRAARTARTARTARMRTGHEIGTPFRAGPRPGRSAVVAPRVRPRRPIPARRPSHHRGRRGHRAGSAIAPTARDTAGLRPASIGQLTAVVLASTPTTKTQPPPLCDHPKSGEKQGQRGTGTGPRPGPSSGQDRAAGGRKPGWGGAGRTTCSPW